MKTIVRKEGWVGGGCLGEIPNCPVKVLTKLFGKPRTNLCEKVKYEWAVSYQEDGRELAAFRIYDYYGDKWHIGGEHTSIVNRGPFNEHLKGFIEILNEMIKNAS